MVNFSDIDWTASACPVSNHFSVREALWLPQYGRLAVPSDFPGNITWEMVTANAYAFFNNFVDPLRDWAGCAFYVHVATRPPAYNLQISGAKNSAHLYGQAVDFNPAVGSCADLINRMLAEKELDALGIRCENNGPNPGWVHVDNRSPGPSGRYFIP